MRAKSSTKTKFFPSLPRRTHECASLATTTHRHDDVFLALALSTNVVFFSSSPLVCVKVAMCVFFCCFRSVLYDFFHYKRLARDVLFLRKPRQGKKSFCENCGKRHFSIDGFLLSCRRVVYFNPAEFGSLSQQLEELKE